VLRSWINKVSNNYSTITAIIITIIAVFVFIYKFNNRFISKSEEALNSTDQIQKEKPTETGIASKIKLNEMESPPQKSMTLGNTESELSIDDLTVETFTQLTEKIFADMPLRNDLQNLKSSGEAHHYPEPVIRAGHQLGLLKEILVKRPEFEEQGAVFYQKCASEEKAITSVRALCLTNLAKYKATHGEMIDMSKYPERVVELAQQGLNP